jgi:hypothetical protein
MFEENRPGRKVKKRAMRGWRPVAEWAVSAARPARRGLRLV